MNVLEGEKTLRLALHEEHAKRHAKFGHFGSWEVPLYFTSILEEHQAVRSGAGLFDISHMGEFVFEGEGSQNFLDLLLCRNIPQMASGRALYMPLLNDRGGIVDDILLYKSNPKKFLMIVNAGNIEKDAQWIAQCRDRIPGKENFRFEDISSRTGLLALQGPKSAMILAKVLGRSLDSIKYYHFEETPEGMIARTGYTGEDGFELMWPLTDIQLLWNRLFKAGAEWGLVPIGFGARDTLRLEAGMPLYGHDMNDETSPFEAGIGWAVDMNKPQFIGKPALLERMKRDQTKLIGFEMLERGIPRQDYSILVGEEKVGHVTSGSFSPTLQKNIGLGYVNQDHAVLGKRISILIRNLSVAAQIVPLPFYKRK